MAQFFDVCEFLNGFSSPSKGDGDIFGSRARFTKGSRPEPRCDFDESKFSFYSKGAVCVFSPFRRSELGPTLSEIKSDPANADRCAHAVFSMLRKSFAGNLDDSWGVVALPPRRHLNENFAESMAMRFAKLAGIDYIDRIAKVRGRARVNAQYDLIRIPEKKHIIVVDDFCTSGSTLISMRNLLEPYCSMIFFSLPLEIPDYGKYYTFHNNA